MVKRSSDGARVSAAAREFVGPPGSLSTHRRPDNGPFSLDTAEAMRPLILEEYRPLCEAAIEEFGVTHSETNLGGVPTLRIDPPERTRDGSILYFFGGGFVSGSPFEDSVVTSALAATLGMSVYAPHYRLTPEHHHPAALNDAADAYSALLERTDPDQFVVAGESAGGNLALAVVLHAMSDDHALPAVVAAISPWTDLTEPGHSEVVDMDPVMVAGSKWTEIAAAYAADTPLDDPFVSPIYGDFTGFPPTIITTGSRDMLLSDCAKLARVFRRHGVPHELAVWDEMFHVFEFYLELDEARESLDRICEYVARHLR